MKLFLILIALTTCIALSKTILYPLAKRSNGGIGTREQTSRKCTRDAIDGRPGLSSGALHCRERVALLSYFCDPIVGFPSKYGFNRLDPVYDIDGNLLANTWEDLATRRRRLAQIYPIPTNYWTGPFNGEGFGNCLNWTHTGHGYLHGISNFRTKTPCDRNRKIFCLCVDGDILTPAPSPTTVAPTVPTKTPTTPYPTTPTSTSPTTRTPTKSPVSCNCPEGKRCVDTGMNKTCVGVGELSFTLTWDTVGSSWELDLSTVNPGGRVCSYSNPNPNFYNGYCKWDIDDQNESGEPNRAYPLGPENIYYSTALPGTYRICVDRDDHALKGRSIGFWMQVRKRGELVAEVKDRLDAGVEYNDEECLSGGGGKLVFTYVF